MTENNNLNVDDEFDIATFVKKVWFDRKVIIKTTLLFFISGCIVALLSPVVYTAQTTFVPQVSEDPMSKASSGLGSLASLAGINLNSAEITSDSYLSPLLYSKLAESEEFTYDIINEEIINLNGDKQTIKEYLLLNKSLFNFFFKLVKFVKKYTIGLFLNNKTIDNNSAIFKDYNYLSEEEFDLVESFKEKFSIELYNKEGYIEVTASDKDAFISTQLVQKITENLQVKIIELRTIKIRERLEFSKEQYELKQIEFDFLQNELAEFKDSNKNISTARFMSELQKLESEYQLQQNILINLASEYNNNKIKLNKDTPIFSVIDEVSVPNKRSKPKRTSLVITFIFIGLILSIGFALLKESLNNFLKEIKD